MSKQNISVSADSVETKVLGLRIPANPWHQLWLGIALQAAGRLVVEYAHIVIVCSIGLPLCVASGIYFGISGMSCWLHWSNSVNEVWRLRRGVPFTATEAPISSMVAGETVMKRAKREELDLNVDDVLGRIAYDRVCGDCGYTVCAPGCGSDDREGAYYPTPVEKARGMVQSVLSNEYKCLGCEWRSGTQGRTLSEFRFVDHTCSGWPEGTFVDMRTCAVCGPSETFPTLEQADAWGKEHRNCEDDSDGR